MPLSARARPLPALVCALASAAIFFPPSAAQVPWPATYVMNASTFVYTCNYTGLTDVSAGSIVSRFGLVAFDWSEAKAV
jgi:hypothetical protein